MTLLGAKNLTVTYRSDGRSVQALRGVTLNVCSGEIVGIIGESGSGKSTLARTLMGLERIESGEITFEGRGIARAGERRKMDKAFARAVQYVFQDAAGALNPRMVNWRAATEPAALLDSVVAKRERRSLAEHLFERVRLPKDVLDAYPHALSGGQRQRLALCRALSAPLRLMILDEPTSALDVSVQATVLDQLLSLAHAGLTLLIISHDVAVVRHMCTRVLVMQGGQVVEDAPRETLFTAPTHPYTRALLTSAGFSARGAPLQPQ